MIKAIDHVINIDLANKINTNQSIIIKKNDNASHNFKINILNNGALYDITGSTARVYFLKSDKTTIFQDCTVDDDISGKISCLLSTQTLTSCGLTYSEITIYGTSGEILTSVTFSFMVSNNIRDDETIASTSEFTSLTNALVKVDGWNDQFQTKYDGLDTLYATDITNIKSDLANISSQNLVADIQASHYKVGDKIHSKLYGGSWWEVKASVTLGYLAIINFTDELHIIVNLIGGGTGIAECQLSSVIDYAKTICSTKGAETFARLKRGQTVVIECKGDSITYGQNNNEGTAIDKTGVATNFGDGSVYDSNKQDANPFPNVLESALRVYYGVSNITVKNCGYPGDWVGGSYVRHRINQGSTFAILELGINDMLMNSGAGIAPDKITDDTDPFSLNNFVTNYRKYIIREMLRGNAIVLVLAHDWVYSTNETDLMHLYNNAIKQLGYELNVAVIDFSEYLGSIDLTGILFGVHPSHLGCNILGLATASLFNKNTYYMDLKINTDWINLTLLGTNYSVMGTTAQYKIEDNCIKFRGLIEQDTFNADTKLFDLPYVKRIPTSYEGRLFNMVSEQAILSCVSNSIWWKAQTKTPMCNLAELVIYLSYSH